MIEQIKSAIADKPVSSLLPLTTAMSYITQMDVEIQNIKTKASVLDPDKKYSYWEAVEVIWGVTGDKDVDKRHYGRLTDWIYDFKVPISIRINPETGKAFRGNTREFAAKDLQYLFGKQQQSEQRKLTRYCKYFNATVACGADMLGFGKDLLEMTPDEGKQAYALLLAKMKAGAPDWDTSKTIDETIAEGEYLYRQRMADALKANDEKWVARVRAVRKDYLEVREHHALLQERCNKLQDSSYKKTDQIIDLEGTIRKLQERNKRLAEDKDGLETDLDYANNVIRAQEERKKAAAQKRKANKPTDTKYDKDTVILTALKRYLGIKLNSRNCRSKYDFL